MFFNDKYNDVAYHLIYVITIGLSGSAFYYMLTKMFREHPVNFIFSTTYALCAYNFMYVINIWAIGLIMMPFQVLALEHLIKNKKILFYILVTLLGIFIQPFCAYMILIFTGLWFIYKLVLLAEKQQIIEAVKLYIIANLSAFLLSAFWTLPVKLMLEGGKYTPTIGFNFSPSFNFPEIFRNMFTGSILGLGIDNAPFIFVGTALFLLVFMYFGCEKFTKREKLASAGFLFFLFISLYLSAFLTIWNAFTQYPDANIFRCCNVLVFFALILSYQAFQYSETINKKWLFGVTGVYLIIGLIVLATKNAINSPYFVIIDCIFAILTAAALFINKEGKYVLPMLIAFAVFQLVDVTINSCIALEKSNEYNISKVSEYKAHYEKIANLVDYAKKNDKTLYRMESDSTGYKEYYAEKYNNMPLNYNYNGISHYSSLGKFYVVDFYRKLGFETGDNAHILMHYESELPAYADFIAGIKYIITDKPLDNKVYEQIEDESTEFSFPYKLYKNPYALPLAFVASKKVLEDEEINNLKGFEYRNKLAKLLAGKDFGDIYFLPEEIKDYSKEYGRFILSFFYMAKADLPLYITILQDNAPPRFDLLTKNDYTIIPAVADVNLNSGYLGWYEGDDTIKVGLEHRYNNEVLMFKETEYWFPFKKYLKTKSMQDYFYHETKYLPLEIWVAYENQDVIREYYDEIMQFPCTLNRISSSHFKGKVTMPDYDRVLMTTIPYEKDWNITVDKRSVKYFKALNSMIAIPVPEGDHSIEMRYIPRGLGAGSIVSILTLILLIIGFRRYREYI